MFAACGEVSFIRRERCGDSTVVDRQVQRAVRGYEVPHPHSRPNPADEMQAVCRRPDEEPELVGAIVRAAERLAVPSARGTDDPPWSTAQRIVDADAAFDAERDASHARHWIDVRKLGR
jgi:hypothetical protein